MTPCKFRTLDAIMRKRGESPLKRASKNKDSSNR